MLGVQMLTLTEEEIALLTSSSTNAAIADALYSLASDILERDPVEGRMVFVLLIEAERRIRRQQTEETSSVSAAILFEREACARIVDGIARTYPTSYQLTSAVERAAMAIRQPRES